MTHSRIAGDAMIRVYREQTLAVLPNIFFFMYMPRVPVGFPGVLWPDFEPSCYRVEC